MNLEVDGVLVAAHELKAPLAVMRQLALAFEGAGSEDEHIRSEMLNVSERAIRQVNDLTKIRRLEDGLFEMEPVAVREVCDAVTQELRRLFESQNHELKVNYSNRARLVAANRDLLYSVVYNFLINAMHYANSESRAELAVQDSKGKVKVTVRDYGPSLPIDVWREIKKGWVEKPLSVAMRSGSSGLGLFIASKFSRYMNAKVGAVRHRDGTSFYVELLASQQARLF